MPFSRIFFFHVENDYRRALQVGQNFVYRCFRLNFCPNEFQKGFCICQNNVSPFFGVCPYSMSTDFPFCPNNCIQKIMKYLKRKINFVIFQDTDIRAKLENYDADNSDKICKIIRTKHEFQILVLRTKPLVQRTSNFPCIYFLSDLEGILR